MSKSLSLEAKLDIYQRMLQIRASDLKMCELFKKGDITGHMLPCLGQEAIPSTLAEVYEKDDCLVTAHRGGGHYMAKGCDFNAMWAELYGRTTGTTKGRGGQLHLIDMSHYAITGNAIVGQHWGIATGAGFVARKRGKMVVAVGGEGSTNRGVFHESMNMAMIWKLPIIFVRTNNLYAESTPQADFQGIPDIVQWAAGYGMPSYSVDGNNVLEIYETTVKAVAHARAGNGPSFLNCRTYRWYGHNIGDPGTDRPKDEIEAWKAKDPIKQYQEYLIDNKLASLSEIEAIDNQERELTEKSIERAEKAAAPALDTVYEGLYVDTVLGKKAIQGDR